MTREDITRMAREAGMVWASGLNGSGYHINHPESIERFFQSAYAAGAAAEREACAKVCDDWPNGTAFDNGQACADAIRARGNI